MDLSLPLLNGMEVAQTLWQFGSTAKIGFLTLPDDLAFVRASFAARAMGYVIKSRIAGDLVLAVREAVAERISISPSFVPASMPSSRLASVCVKKSVVRATRAAGGAVTFASSKHRGTRIR
jgi:DNA-binding NarL/FixJ family response regulator